jgi:MFS family permease
MQPTDSFAANINAFSFRARRKGVTAIASVITTGICVVFVGVNAEKYWLVLLGRLIYGLGGESVYVGIDILTTKWCVQRRQCYRRGRMLAVEQRYRSAPAGDQPATDRDP